MYDATLFYRERAREHVSLKQWNLEDSKFALCTIQNAKGGIFSLKCPALH